jgi:succinoglycan biosynthesis transport protein ExoP
VSRNFDLMQRAGKGIGRQHPADVSVQLGERSTSRIEAAVPAGDSRVSDWLHALEVLQKRWRYSAAFALVVMLTVIAVTYLMTPTYEATARIEIDPPGEVFSLDGGAAVSDAEYLETEAQVLQTDNLAIDVVRKMHLDRYPELTGDTKDLVATVPSPSDAEQLTAAEKAALAGFRARLKVKRDTSSRLIQISFSSHDPEFAAQVTNAVVGTFIEDTFQTRHNAIMKSSEWLSRQLDDIRAKMENSSHALAEFQGSVGIADVDADKSTYSEHMSELSRQYTLAETERIQIQSLLKNMQGNNPDSLPEVRSNPVVQQLSQKLAEQRAELAQTLVVYGKNHPAARKLQSQVDELQSQLDAQKHATVNSLRASYAAAEAREQLMAAEMKGTTKEMGQMARYTALKKELQTDVELYNSLYAKIKEAGIAAASKSANIRVVDAARPPETPASPRRLLNLAVGLLAAIFGGVALAFVSEELDNKLHSPEDIRRWIGSSNVSIIPVIGEAERQEARLPWPRRMVRLLPSSTAGEPQTNTFFLERPNSPEGEAVQALYASIMLAWPGNPPQALLMASSFPGEGKTTVALNLSYALAKQGRTCLVDADLRKGRLARAFSLNASQGLSEVLKGTAALDGALLEVPGMSNLSILPAGLLKGNAGSLICSETMQMVVQELRQRFQFVVIDSAPILPFVDGRALSTLVDAVILVGRSGVTTRQAMRRSVELLSEIHGAPILQVVLNAADQSATDYKQYGYGYAYQDTTLP